ncbi:MAG: septation regulator SpoVG [Acidobacteria bacterium]|nr:septation regulator SpoVG [Acidobacteriota bacterium]
MEITDIRVFPVDEEKLKAFVTVVFDQCFVVCDIKVINGTNGLFISMPSKRRKNGTFRDIAHPLNSDTRRMIEEKILAAYEDALASGVEPRSVRRPREADDDDDYFEAERAVRRIDGDAAERTRPTLGY